MTTKLEVINQALAYLGDPVVTTLNIANPVINAMSIIYDAEKANLLSWHPWRFATKWEKLIPVISPPNTPPNPRFQYAYELPLDYIQAYDTYFAADYQIVGKLVLSNQAPDWYWGYIYNIPESDFPVYFVLALSHILAAKSATVLTGNTAIAKYWGDQAMIQQMRAQNRDATAVSAVSVRDNPMLANHYYRGF